MSPDFSQIASFAITSVTIELPPDIRHSSLDILEIMRIYLINMQIIHIIYSLDMANIAHYGKRAKDYWIGG